MKHTSLRAMASLLLGVLVVAASATADEGLEITNWTAPPYWSSHSSQKSTRSALVTATPLPFVAVAPCRVADTRPGFGFSGAYGPPFMAGSLARSFTVTGQCGIPATAQAVSFNFTVTNTAGPGFLLVFPEGGAQPNVSTLNYLAGQTIANAAIVPLGNAGGITGIPGVSGFDLVIDVNGYYAPEGVVSSLNGLSGALSIAAGSNVTITPSGSTLTIGSTGGVAFAGSGSAATASHSDHDHAGASWSGPSPFTITSTNPSNPAIHGSANQWGLHGTSSSSNPTSAGVLGETLAAGGNGVFGLGGPGTGVRGTSTGSNGVYGTTSSGVSSGVYGENTSTGGYGVAGRAANGKGVVGETSDGTAVHAEMTGSSGTALLALARGSGVALSAQQINGGMAGFFYGNVSVTGSLSKGGGSFKIDHPLDPENKYLYHSFVESPDMMNIYNGVAVLDTAGEAHVALPAWFDALNRDFRYQLTAMGRPQPDLHVREEIADNKFLIAGGRAGAKVSWQVTGIRRDAWAQAHRIPVEEAKPDTERGRFLHPREHGRGQEDAIDRGQPGALQGGAQ